jgi:hypothetical protein
MELLIIPHTATIGHLQTLLPQIEALPQRAVVTTNPLISEFLENRGFRVYQKSEMLQQNLSEVRESIRSACREWEKTASRPWKYLLYEVRLAIIERMKLLFLLREALSFSEDLDEIFILWESPRWDSVITSLGKNAQTLGNPPDSLAGLSLPPPISPKSPIRIVLERGFKWIHWFYEKLRSARPEEQNLILIPDRETLALAQRMIRQGYRHFSFLSWYSSVRNLKVARSLRLPLYFLDHTQIDNTELPPSKIDEIFAQCFHHLSQLGVWRWKTPDLPLLAVPIEGHLIELARDAWRLEQTLYRKLKGILPKTIVYPVPFTYQADVVFSVCSDLKIKSVGLSHGFGVTENLENRENPNPDYVTFWGKYDLDVSNNWQSKIDIRAHFVDTGPASLDINRPKFKTPCTSMDPKRKQIGIALTALYPLTDLLEFSSYGEERLLIWAANLDPDLKKKIVVRPHPCEPAPYRRYLHNQYGFQRNQERTPDQFIQNCQIAISCFSTLIFTFLNKGIPVVWVDISGRSTDLPPLEKLPLLWRVRTEEDFKKAVHEALAASVTVASNLKPDLSPYLSDRWNLILQASDGLKNIEVLEHY